MTLKDEEIVTTLDPFTHTAKNSNKIKNFDFWNQRHNREGREKVEIDETFCTLVTVGGKFLEKKMLEKVLKKIYQIRRKVREYLSKIFNSISFSLKRHIQ